MGFAYSILSLLELLKERKFVREVVDLVFNAHFPIIT